MNKKERIKKYLYESIIFASVFNIIDILIALIDNSTAQLYLFVNNFVINYLLNFVFSFFFLFIISFVIDYIYFEFIAKKNNK